MRGGGILGNIFENYFAFLKHLQSRTNHVSQKLPTMHCNVNCAQNHKRNGLLYRDLWKMREGAFSETYLKIISPTFSITNKSCFPKASDNLTKL